MSTPLARSLLLVTLATLSCKGQGEPTTSYCEAICDHVVSCAVAERAVDEAALKDQCLTDTRAADPSCAEAESGELGAVGRETLKGCVSALQDATDAGECDDITGRIDDLKAGTAPKECASTGTNVQAVYTAARDAVTETGDALCQRFTDTFCGRLDECVIAALGTIPQAVTDQLGTPLEVCVAKLDVQTQACTTNELYGAEESLQDVNPTRQAARECLRDFAIITCDALLAGDMQESPECAGSFASADDTLAFGLALVETFTEFSDAIDAL